MAGSFGEGSSFAMPDVGRGNDDALAKFLEMMQGGGLFGLGDTATGGLLSMGGALGAGIADLIGGKSDAQKTASKTYGLAENRLGQNVLNPDQYMADYMRARGPENARRSERLNERFGLDSGTAQSQLAFDMEGPLAQFMLNAKMTNDQMKSRNDNMLLSLMAGLSPQM